MMSLPPSSEAPLPDRRIIIPLLGITQIFAWGSSFYLLGVLAPLIARDTGWTYDLIVGGVSVGLLIAGLASPRVGRLIAHKGGRPVLAAGAALLAAGLLGICLAPSFAWYLAGWVVIGFGMSAGLYDAAFATLGNIYGSKSRSAITSVTLFGGFASTVCWPLSAFLAENFGWRGACLVYATIQIAIALPVHLLALPRARVGGPDGAGKARPPVHLQPGEYVVFGLLSVVLTIGAAIMAIIGTHLLPILMARGLDVAAAVGLGAIVGPSQVGARVIEMLAGSRYHPVWTMVASAVLVAIAAAMLILGFPIVALAIALYGAGNGIGSVARGTVPLALFGPDRYPVLMGRLAFPLLMAMAISPFLGGLAFQKGGADWTLALLTTLGLVNVVLVLVLLVITEQHRRA
jgi:predicted MFS family arabinose efflux permease